MTHRRTAAVCAGVLVAAVLGRPSPVAAARGGLCAAVTGDDATAPRVAVLSAFPAEIAALVAAADVTETVTVDERSYHLGTVEGVRVVLGFTGIGLVNATARTRSVLRHFDVGAVVVSGVAGSPHRIGDVVVPEVWTLGDDGPPLRVNPALFALARQAAGDPVLEQCTIANDGATVCMPFVPVIVVGGRGRSDDPFDGNPVACAGTDDIFGCELPAPASVLPLLEGSAQLLDPRPSALGAVPEAAVADDMETAAIARVAARRGVPYVAFRAVSDGAGDPRGDRGFPAQFFDYYHLAADNAGAGAQAFLARLGRLGGDDVTARRACRLLAARRWRRAAALLDRLP